MIDLIRKRSSLRTVKASKWHFLPYFNVEKATLWDPE